MSDMVTIIISATKDHNSQAIELIDRMHQELEKGNYRAARTYHNWALYHLEKVTEHCQKAK